ncbi:MAG: HK97 gp10 family phage protein [Porcipelethomonas sp.]
MLEADEMKAFFDKCIKAGNGDFKRELEVFLEGIGLEFLRIIEDEIIQHKVVDTRLLLNSFHKGDGENVWETTDGGLTLQVGSNVEYAGYVNDGHWTCGKGEAMRFVPGYWEGDRFQYDPSAKSGMMLKQKWVEGKHFWENGIRILDRIMTEILEAKLQQWLDSYFG